MLHLYLNHWIIKPERIGVCNHIDAVIATSCGCLRLVVHCPKHSRDQIFELFRVDMRDKIGNQLIGLRFYYEVRSLICRFVSLMVRVTMSSSCGS